MSDDQFFICPICCKVCLPSNSITIAIHGTTRICWPCAMACKVAVETEMQRDLAREREK
jgi:hypothetical protein